MKQMKSIVKWLANELLQEKKESTHAKMKGICVMDVHYEELILISRKTLYVFFL